MLKRSAATPQTNRSKKRNLVQSLTTYNSIRIGTTTGKTKPDALSQELLVGFYRRRTQRTAFLRHDPQEHQNVSPGYNLTMEQRIQYTRGKYGVSPHEVIPRNCSFKYVLSIMTVEEERKLRVKWGIVSQLDVLLHELNNRSATEPTGYITLRSMYVLSIMTVEEERKLRVKWGIVSQLDVLIHYFAKHGMSEEKTIHRDTGSHRTCKWSSEQFRQNKAPVVGMSRIWIHSVHEDGGQNAVYNAKNTTYLDPQRTRRWWSKRCGSRRQDPNPNRNL
ncbi:hypothetical protein BT69DRAFT_1293204 [Atractiella rhizophila]|nr:hypothetical protein BT69DRAFT_1293204 [Atractiella rhizophila]